VNGKVIAIAGLLAVSACGAGSDEDQVRDTVETY